MILRIFLIIGCLLTIVSTNAQLIERSKIKEKFESEKIKINEKLDALEITRYDKEQNYYFTINYLFGTNPSNKNYNRLIKVIYTSDNNKVLRSSFWAIINKSHSFIRIKTNYYYDPTRKLSFSYNYKYNEEYILIDYTKLYEKDSI